MIIKIDVECIPEQGETETLSIKAEVADSDKKLGPEGILWPMAKTFRVAKESVVSDEKDLVLRLVGEVLEEENRG